MSAEKESCGWVDAVSLDVLILDLCLTHVPDLERAEAFGWFTRTMPNSVIGPFPYLSSMSAACNPKPATRTTAQASQSKSKVKKKKKSKEE